jgi:uncharacterized protein YgbK (DUF1537 family)
LITAGSGVAIGLPQNFGLSANAHATTLPPRTGSQAIVSGSCSAATNAQVARAIASGVPAFALDTQALSAGETAVTVLTAQALHWAKPLLSGSRPILIYSTAQANDVRTVQATLGQAVSGALIERTLSEIARGLVALGVGQLIVAGGETSGACVQALGITQMQIGPQIDPGVPWCYATGSLHLALKSGNFGSEDFFTKAFTLLA